MEKSSQAGWDCRTKEQHRGRLIRFFFRLLCPTVGAGEAGNPEITMTQTALQKPCFLCLEHEGRGSLARRNTFRWQLPYSSQAPWKKQGPHPTPVTKIWEGPRCSQVVTRHTPPPQGVGGVRDCYGLPTTWVLIALCSVSGSTEAPGWCLRQRTSSGDPELLK